MGVWAIFKRELASYFLTPLAYIFIIIFLVLTATFTFFVGGFFEGGQASLQGFFGFHPWLYLVLTPAVAMRLWAEERKSGTLELLLTLPVSIGSAVAGKFLAAWAFTTIALALTFPLWITVNYLGEPDNGVILASYIGSALLAGAYLALGSALSALTHRPRPGSRSSRSGTSMFSGPTTKRISRGFGSTSPVAMQRRLVALRSSRSDSRSGSGSGDGPVMSSGCPAGGCSAGAISPSPPRLHPRTSARAPP